MKLAIVDAIFGAVMLSTGVAVAAAPLAAVETRWAGSSVGGMPLTAAVAADGAVVIGGGGGPRNCPPLFLQGKATAVGGGHLRFVASDRRCALDLRVVGTRMSVRENGCGARPPGCAVSGVLERTAG